MHKKNLTSFTDIGVLYSGLSPTEHQNHINRRKPMIKKINAKKENILTAEESLEVKAGKKKCIFACGCTSNCGTTAISNYNYNQSYNNTLGSEPLPED